MNSFMLAYRKPRRKKIFKETNPSRLLIRDNYRAIVESEDASNKTPSNVNTPSPSYAVATDAPQNIYSIPLKMSSNNLPERSFGVPTWLNENVFAIGVRRRYTSSLPVPMTRQTRRGAAVVPTPIKPVSRYIRVHESMTHFVFIF